MQSTGKMGERLLLFYEAANKKFMEQFGFNMKDTTFANVVGYMHTSKDSSSLAVTRILFGLAMLFDIADERGGANMDKRWGDPQTCHFPLLPFLQPLLLPYMALVYAAMWFGALGIMLGYKYRICATVFTISYWYLFLVEKSFWNNHSYLFGIVGLLLTCTRADSYWSIDAYRDPSKRKETVPYWNYFVLKYQFFILYFMAGMKKGTAEWLTGYSVQNLSEHWVFDPFKLFLTVPQTDFLVVHWFAFMFDLTVAIWMMWSYSRHLAMFFCALFHLMNSRLFRIGMFPWVCLATMPLFYPFDWPKLVFRYFTTYCHLTNSEINGKICGLMQITDSENKNADDQSNRSMVESKKSKDYFEDIGSDSEERNKTSDNASTITKAKNKKRGKNGICNDQLEETNLSSSIITTVQKANDKFVCWDKKMTVYLIMFHILSQAFLPYSHFITKGFNNWTNGLYGYSWDMMVHTWDIRSVVIKVVDNDDNKEMYIDPYLYTLNDRWTRHGDMVLQHAECLRNNIARQRNWNKPISNISIYVDIWCSMNGRFVQRIFDPKVDMLKTSWSPFQKVSFLMPLMNEAVTWRKDLDVIRNVVHSWSNQSDAVFFADYPGSYQEKYIPYELQNTSLTVLEGIALYEPEVTQFQIGQSFRLERGDMIKITPGTYHKVKNIGNDPLYYMYTFSNISDLFEKNINEPKPMLPIFQEFYDRLANVVKFLTLLADNFFGLFNLSQENFTKIM